MNQKQRDYAINRCNDTEKAKIKEVERKHTTPKKELSGEEKVALVRAGKVKLLPDVSYYTDLYRAFDFSAHEREEKIDPKAAPIIEKIRKLGRATRDMIMLADGDTAAAALHDFEKELAKI